MKIMTVENEQHYQDALKVRKTVFVEEQKVPMELEVDEYEKDATHIVAYENDKPVGAGRFRVKNGAAKVERICVLKEMRGHHVGLEIMKKIEALATSKGLTTLVLHAQTHAQSFYEKLGYQVTSGLFYDAGIPHVEMEKSIKNATTTA